MYSSTKINIQEFPEKNITNYFVVPIPTKAEQYDRETDPIGIVATLMSLTYIFYMNLLLTAIIAFTVSVISGTLGLGGAVLLIPAYLYLPGVFGVTALDMKSISGMTSIQVFSASLFGMMFHQKRGAVNKRLVLAMGIPITIASLTGALFSKSIEQNIIITTFAIMAIIGTVLVILRKEPVGQELLHETSFNMPGAIIIATAVGFFGGIVGAPGAFLLSPLMMTILKIPTRITIGSTLGVVLFSAFAASIGKIVTEQVPYVPTLVAVVCAIPGAYLGSTFSHHLPVKTLRIALAVVIAGVALQMLYRAFMSS